jgi:hypothetical protein
MRLTFCLFAVLGMTSAPALAQTDTPAPSPAAELPGPELDTNSARRQALFDLAFNALVDGNLGLAERAFIDAAALPGDPAQSAVARSFVERVQHLQSRRRADASRRGEVSRRPDLEVESEVGPAPRRDAGRAERIALLGTTTALGLGVYGWTVPGVLGVQASQSTRAFVGTYMLTAAGSFIVPYLLLHERTTAGQTNLAFYGGTRGIWLGVLVGALAAGDLGPDHRYRGWTTGLLVGSIAGLVGGYQFAGAAGLSAGEARTMAAVGDLGLALGFGAGFLLHFDARAAGCAPFAGNAVCFSPDPEQDAHARKMAFMGLLGSGLGLTGGYFLGRARNNTWGDGEVLRAGTLLGTWSAFGVADVARAHVALSNPALTGPLMAGGVVGLLVGDRLVRNTDFTVGQSMLIDLSMISGGLLGAGTTYLFPGIDADKPYIMASAVGALGGFALAYWGFHDAAEGPAARRLSHLSRRGFAVIPTAGTQGHRGLAVAGLF